ncbi:protein SENSITIVE TO PROTON RHIZOTOXICITY 1-like [Camellia sinensis]|uniref:protein SENSITIVE TO PROTON RHIZOTOXICITY 1-like n=1 Tax=Camellia sinensis TaxID=4442 RepID=UPI001036C709|nr:protein SENSITIVE TO PROTON RHIZOTOXICITY 1-like [Camellia sinensis]
MPEFRRRFGALAVELVFRRDGRKAGGRCCGGVAEATEEETLVTRCRERERRERERNEMCDSSRIQDWDPRAMLNNLSFVEQKIHQLQDLVHLVVSRRGQVVTRSDELVSQQQQLITADLASIIVQLISIAGSLLPSVKQTRYTNPSITQFGQLGGVIFPSGPNLNGSAVQQNIGGRKVSDQSNHVDLAGSCKIEQNYFCMICGKGFKRDANLRMHMRGHGDEYKTPAARNVAAE